MKASLSYKTAAAAFIAVAVVACSSGGFNPSPAGSGAQGGHVGAPRSAYDYAIGNTQAFVNNGVLLQPLTVTNTNNVLSVTLYGAATCASANLTCPGVPNAPAYSTPQNATSSIPVTVSATSLATACSSAGAPSPAPGFTPACYVVAFEGGYGPYEVQGPATVSGGSLNFAATTTPMYLQGGGTPYNFYLAYVTDMAAAPPPLTPSPVPTPTYFATPPPACGKFAVLSTNPQWANVHFQYNALTQGDVGVFGPGQFHVEQNATINGTARVVAGTHVQVNGATITGGVVVDQPTIASAVSRAEALNATDGALAPTGSINAINIGQGQSMTINGTAGVNVLSLSSLEMNHNTTLTLNAPAGSSFVINVSGEMRIGNTAQILLAGGITPANVVLNFTGSNGQIWVQYTSVVNGTILAPYRTNVHVDHTTTINGAVIGDGQVMEFAWGDVVGTGCGF